MVVVCFIQVFEHCVEGNLDVPNALELVQIRFKLMQIRMNRVQVHLDFEQLNAEFEEVILSLPELFDFFFEGGDLFHGHVLRQVFVVRLTRFVLLIFEFFDVLLELGQVFVAEVFLEAIVLLVHHLLILVDFVDDASFVLFDVLPAFHHVFGQFGVSVFLGKEFIRIFDLVEVLLQLVEVVFLIP